MAPGAIEIEFVSGARMRLMGPVDAYADKAMVAVLAKAKRRTRSEWRAGEAGERHADMSKGFEGLAVLMQETLKRNPHNGHLFVFRGRRGGLIKVPWHDGQGMCLFAKRP